MSLATLTAIISIAMARPGGTMKVLVDGQPCDLGDVPSHPNDGYEVDVEKTINAITGGNGRIKFSGSEATLEIDGRKVLTMPSVDGTKNATFSKARSKTATYFRRDGSLAFTSDLKDYPEKRENGTRTMFLNDLAGLLGASVDEDGDTLQVYTPAYWARRLDLPDNFVAALAHSQPDQIPDFGVSPPSANIFIWVRPETDCYVQIYRLSEATASPMFGLDASGHQVTVDSSESALRRQVKRRTTTRAEQLVVKPEELREVSYAAILSPVDPGNADLRDFIRAGKVDPTQIQVVGITQRVLPNPVQYGVHSVKSGESAATVSVQYKMEPSLLLELNGLKQNEVKAGMKLIVIEDVKPLEIKESPDYSVVGRHHVTSGDTLEKLAASWRVDPKQIMEANEGVFDGDKLIPGTIIQKIKSSGAPASEGNVPNQAYESGQVKKQSTMYEEQVGGTPAVQLPAGTQVDVLNKVDNGYQVVHNGKTGYVSGTNFTANPSPRPVQNLSMGQLPTPDPHNAMGVTIVREAAKFRGLPYVWGGNSLRSGIDCSHFVSAVYMRVGRPCPEPPVKTQEVLGPDGRAAMPVHWKQPGGEALRGDRTVAMPNYNPSLKYLQPGDRFIIQRGLTGKDGSRHTGLYAGPIYVGKRFYPNAVIHACRPGVSINDLHDGKIWNNYRFMMPGLRRGVAQEIPGKRVAVRKQKVAKG